MTLCNSLQLHSNLTFLLHFLCFQLVWSDTVKVGIATAVSPWYGLITVARFYPRGNIGFVDDYVANVSPAGKKLLFIYPSLSFGQPPAL